MQVSSVSLKGLRDQNEDQHNIIINMKNKHKNIKDINFFAIYDGHGGKEVSKAVSDILPVFFLNKNIQYPMSKEDVTKIYDYVEKKVESIPQSKQCGSTSLTVSQYKHSGGTYLDITNLGDCKAVLCKEYRAIALTREHRPMWPDEKKRIEQLGGKVIFDGDDWRIKDYSVSRSFGDVNAKPYMSHKPDLYKYKLDSKDKFFILGCDGLWDYVSEQDVINYVLANVYPKGKKVKDATKNIAGKIARLALKKGSTDNVSVIAVFL